jgi:hypothetical protein
MIGQISIKGEKKTKKIPSKKDGEEARNFYHIAGYQSVSSCWTISFTTKPKAGHPQSSFLLKSTHF